MDVVSLFLEKDVLPEEKSEADKVRRKAPRLVIRGQKTVQAFVLWALFVVCPPRGIGVTSRGIA